MSHQLGDGHGGAQARGCSIFLQHIFNPSNARLNLNMHLVLTLCSQCFAGRSWPVAQCNACRAACQNRAQTMITAYCRRSMCRCCLVGSFTVPVFAVALILGPTNTGTALLVQPNIAILAPCGISSLTSPQVLRALRPPDGRTVLPQPGCLAAKDVRPHSAGHGRTLTALERTGI